MGDLLAGVLTGSSDDDVDDDENGDQNVHSGHDDESSKSASADAAAAEAALKAAAAEEALAELDKRKHAILQRLNPREDRGGGGGERLPPGVGGRSDQGQSRQRSRSPVRAHHWLRCRP